MMRRVATLERAERRAAVWLAMPAALFVLGGALVPIAATMWEALHLHDLRLPWLGRPFIGAGNFVEAVGDARFLDALARTIGFALVTVPLELVLALALALAMDAAIRMRGLARLALLLPWTIPTVVAALIWRFMADERWFVTPLAAWIPIGAADIWKTTPFVAILLLAGLQTIDPALHEAASIDGAGPGRRFWTITLPLLRPAIVVGTAFRILDALRIFDLPYVMTGGGPGTATEPLSLYAFIALMQRLRFGYGSALSVAVFLLTLSFALVWVRAFGRSLVGEDR
jgi:ABC-type sugar transport system permease subunit